MSIVAKPIAAMYSGNLKQESTAIKTGGCRMINGSSATSLACLCFHSIE